MNRSEYICEEEDVDTDHRIVYVLLISWLVIIFLIISNMYATAFLLASILVATHAAVHIRDPSVAGLQPRIGLGNFLENFKDKLRTGDEDLGLPPMDPFESIQENIEFEKEGLGQLTALLTNIRADGISGYNVVEGDFAIIGMKLKLALHWPEITGKTHYIAKGTLGDTVPIWGNGDISAIVKDLRFSTTIGLSVRDGHLYVRTIESTVSLGGLDLTATGLFDDEELSAILSSAISEMTPQLIDDYQAEIVKIVNDIITNVANDFLASKSLKDLIDMIGG